MNSKCIEDWNVRPETIKLLENIGSLTLDLGIHVWIETKSKAAKPKNKWDILKLKSFYTGKKTINKIKKKKKRKAHLLNGRKCLQIKHPIRVKIYKELTQLNNQKLTVQFNNGQIWIDLYFWLHFQYILSHAA